ncbi:arylesterase [Sphingomonas sp.]|uniref:arylesterase n=1 Tax=Sphingomonas sp. TaxID=28214 RepID=UPI002CE25658|nr:arylesterase [Sphingomonas sp.]HTG38225.1 arylesterase [Sphingomonas sp.]
MKSPLSYALAAALIQMLGACSTEPGAPAPAPTPSATAEAADQRLVLAFGDSLYAGYGVLPQQAFPYVLEQRLRGGGVSASVRNAGVSGDTTAAGLRRLAFTLDGLSRKPDLAIVGLGGNDMLRGIDPAETRANLDAICAELQRRGIPIVLTGMRAAPNLGADYVEAFEGIYPDLAAKYDAPLDPFFLDGVVTQSALMLPDRIHPNPQGIERIVDRVTPLIVRALSPSRSS